MNFLVLNCWCISSTSSRTLQLSFNYGIAALQKQFNNENGVPLEATTAAASALCILYNGSRKCCVRWNFIGIFCIKVVLYLKF